ncbi:MAG: hypothetical protein CVT64_10205 [Actinobacteria bacterium HGW-Actinobacteria-4]|nr:MAG: hypothetical protein CVT64_10205 [Actinobacteria bacterium HGW-Actinobacteria-4]
MTIVAVAAVTAIALTACTPELPVAGTAPAVEEPSAMTDSQVDRVIDETFAELRLADAALDPAPLTLRVGGDAAQVRAAQYLQAKVADGPAPDALPEDMLAVYVTSAEQWPRVMVGVTAEPEGGLTPVVMMWVQDDISTPYQLRHWAPMVPGASMPAMAGTSQGSEQVTLGENSVTPSPRAVVEDYMQLLREGPTSELNAQFAADGYRDRLFAARTALTSAAATAGGKYIDTVQPQMDKTFALKTADGGTFVLAPILIASSFSVTNAKVSVPAIDAPLVDGALNATVTHHYVDFIVLYVPGPGSERTLPAVVAADHHLVRVSAS